MTHKPGHATDPNYDKLHWKVKQSYDKMTNQVNQDSDETKKRNNGK